jgi:hypothetical protein
MENGLYTHGLSNHGVLQLSRKFWSGVAVAHPPLRKIDGNFELKVKKGLLAIWNLDV